MLTRGRNYRVMPADNPAMRWHDIAPAYDVPERPGRLTVDRLGLELLVFWGGGEPTRAVWRWARTGRVACWAAVGLA